MARTKSSTPKANTVSAAKKTSPTGATTLDSTIGPAAFLTFFGAFMLVASLPGAFGFTFIEPLVSILFVAFGILCVWRIARREAIRKYVRVVAWILTVVFMLAIIYWFGGANDNTCTGFMGVQTECMGNNRVMITFLLVNPFSLTLWAALAASGVMGLLIKPSKS